MLWQRFEYYYYCLSLSQVQVDLMMNPQVRVIPPAILQIATLINFVPDLYSSGYPWMVRGLSW